MSVSGGTLERLHEDNIRPLSLIVIERLRLTRIRAEGAWLLLTSVWVLPLLALARLSGDLKEALAPLLLAATGFYLCYWGSLYGLRILLDTTSDIVHTVNGGEAATREELVEAIRRWTSLRITVLAWVVVGAIFTALVYNQVDAGGSFGFFLNSFPAYWVFFFLSAAGIGVGHACIGGALSVARKIHKMGWRSTYHTHHVERVARNFIWLAGLCLLVYANYLVYMMLVWNVERAPVGYALAIAFVGLVVLAIILYPQWVIHGELKANKSALLTNAIKELEEISTHETGPAQREALLQSMSYLREIEGMRTWGFSFKQLAVPVSTYLIPTVAFLVKTVPAFGAVLPIVDWIQ